jgi:2-keto-4-pentenoate hydratase/2-oxohepta-3-ene-1,7-dioic acid hydratase in catechol pathway
VVSGSTESMAFSVPELVPHTSKIVHLHEGDLLALGDPGNPSRYIDDASVVTCRIEKIGKLTNPVARLNS